MIARSTVVGILFVACPVQGGLVAFEDSYHVLTGRQRYVSLRAFQVDDSDPSLIADSDLFIWRVTKGPRNGRLLGTVPNLMYVPNEGYTGDDDFTYRVEYKSDFRDGVIRLHVAHDYVPPYGIRPPDFGVITSHTGIAKEARYDYGKGPEPYRRTKAGPYTHFVDFEKGDDIGNSLGTPEKPRRSIPTQLLQAGSIVEIHGAAADRDVGNSIVILADLNTTEQRPVILRGAGAADKPLLRRGLVIRGNYVIVENIDFDCSQPGNTREWILVCEWQTNRKPAAWATYHHVVVRHCSLRGFPSGMTGGASAIGFRTTHEENGPGTAPNDDRHRIEHVVVYDVSVRDFGSWTGRDDISDYVGCQFAVNSRFGWCLDSVFDHIQGDGVSLSRNNGMMGQAPSQDIYVGGNHIHHVKENCIDVKMTRRAILSQNHFYRLRLSNSSMGQAISIQNDDHCDTWPYSDQVWVLFNEIYDAPFGVLCGPKIHRRANGKPHYAESRVFVIGNVIHHIQPFDATPPGNFGAAVSHYAQTQSRVVNNTFYSCVTGINIGCLQETAFPSNENTSTAIVNNLFLDSIRGGVSIRSCRKGVSEPVIAEFRQCLLWPRVGLDIGSRVYTTLENFDRDGRATSRELGLLNCNPDVRGVLKLDLRPVAPSPAANAGICDRSFGDFQALFPRGQGFPTIAHDLHGVFHESKPPIGALCP